jgi:hypothetical protein
MLVKKTMMKQQPQTVARAVNRGVSFKAQQLKKKKEGEMNKRGGGDVICGHIWEGFAVLLQTVPHTHSHSPPRNHQHPNPCRQQSSRIINHLRKGQGLEVFLCLPLLLQHPMPLAYGELLVSPRLGFHAELPVSALLAPENKRKRRTRRRRTRRTRG